MTTKKPASTRPAQRCGGCGLPMAIRSGHYECENARCRWTLRRRGQIECRRCHQIEPAATAHEGYCEDCWEQEMATGAYIESEMKAIAAMRERLKEIESDIQAQREKVPLFMIDGPDEMDYQRAQGRDYGPEADALDGMYRQYAAIEEAIIRREHELGYL